MAELGHEVLGVDTDARKIAALAEGRAPFFEPNLDDMLVSNITAGRLRFGTSLADAARFAELHFLCVGTPQLPGSLGADLSSIEAAIDGLGPRLDSRLPGGREVNRPGRDRPAASRETEQSYLGRRCGRAGLEPGIPA